ncbi:hypothetical protein TRIUR3_16277 [Triticum urartu]|uniref:UspA domain-containing protein n=1 Tax=Triticum urartu TaxID=4572 RepID=M7YGT2_TRIUA|nr:hypothetical protein TRIUR3_16277 [Triticum urartu]
MARTSQDSLIWPPQPAYSRDRHASVQEALLPFRRLAKANVETVVVEGDGVAETLVRYAAESGVRSLVLGSGSFRWFHRR